MLIFESRPPPHPPPIPLSAGRWQLPGVSPFVVVVVVIINMNRPRDIDVKDSFRNGIPALNGIFGVAAIVFSAMYYHGATPTTVSILGDVFFFLKHLPLYADHALYFLPYKPDPYAFIFSAAVCLLLGATDYYKNEVFRKYKALVPHSPDYLHLAFEMLMHHTINFTIVLTFIPCWLAIGLIHHNNIVAFAFTAFVANCLIFDRTVEEFMPYENTTDASGGKKQLALSSYRYPTIGFILWLYIFFRMIFTMVKLPPSTGVVWTLGIFSMAWLFLFLVVAMLMLWNGMREIEMFGISYLALQHFCAGALLFAISLTLSLGNLLLKDSGLVIFDFGPGMNNVLTAV